MEFVTFLTVCALLGCFTINSSSGQSVTNVQSIADVSQYLAKVLSSNSSIDPSQPLFILSGSSNFNVTDGTPRTLKWFALTSDSFSVSALTTLNANAVKISLTSLTAQNVSSNTPVTPTGPKTSVISAPAAQAGVTSEISAPSVQAVIPGNPVSTSDQTPCDVQGPYDRNDPSTWPLLFDPNNITDPEGLKSKHVDAANLPAIQDYIVRKHNCLRSKVKPQASNMLKMIWNNELSAKAQAWADQCHNYHNDVNITNFPGCGQNIASSSPWPFSWNSQINLWYSELKKFTYGASNNLNSVGHYTAITWGTTYQVGCGYKDCNGWHFYVCNYAPGGNFGSLSNPYKEGKPCGDCPDSCDKGLCTNSCPYVDDYNVCEDFQAKYQVCTNKAMKSQAAGCKATCLCPGKIHTYWG